MKVELLIIIFLVLYFIRTVFDVYAFFLNKKATAFADAMAAAGKQIALRDETINEQKKLISNLNAYAIELKHENEELKKKPTEKNTNDIT